MMHDMQCADVEIPTRLYNNGPITTILDVRNCNVLSPKSVELLDAQSSQFVIGFLVFSMSCKLRLFEPISQVQTNITISITFLPLFLFLGCPYYGHAYHTL